jgi:hypothetical protein
LSANPELRLLSSKNSSSVSTATVHLAVGESIDKFAKFVNYVSFNKNSSTGFTGIPLSLSALKSIRQG